MNAEIIVKEQRIKALREEAERLQEEVDSVQRSCRHTHWEEAVYDPEEIQEATDFRLVTQGSDAWLSVPTGYRTKKIPRWRRSCKSCGKTEYTKEQTPTKYEPKFR